MRILKSILAVFFIAIVTRTAAAQSALDQLKAYDTPTPAKPALAEGSGTADGTAKLAAAAGKYDIIGIKLGMPLKEALLTLKAHSANFTAQPDNLKYDVFPNLLTYGITLVSAIVLRNAYHIMQPNTEKYYFMAALPPNPAVVTKISRFVMFDKTTAPTQEGLIADLVKKYGPISFQRDVAGLDLFWVDDSQGKRLQTSTVANCTLMTTFVLPIANGADFGGAADLQPEPANVKNRLENGFVNPREGMAGGECGTYTMIRAHLYGPYRSLGIDTPGVVGALVVMIGSGPLDRSATEATHQHLLQAVKERDIKNKEEAGKNRPSL